MDHAINSVRAFLEIEVDMLREEWDSGDYKKLSDCPSYGAAKALNDATNCMRKYLDWDTITLRERVIEMI